MKKSIILIIAIVGLLFNSCEVTDFDLQENPNQLTPDAISPDFLLNEIQLQFSEYIRTLSLNTDDVMRYENMSDTYADIAEPSALNGEWDLAYKMRENTKILENLAVDNDALLFHRGVAKILHAYGFATLVDYLGDVPFTEANIAGNFNPGSDDDAGIYEMLIADIDLGITDLNNATVEPQLDLYFGGDASKWVKLANSLKLKLYVNMGSVNEINSLIADGNLITALSDDFQFQHSNALTPESRHLYFRRGYLPSGFTQYMGNYFMWLLKDSKTVRDPRLRYYIYRQTNIDPTGGFLKCEQGDVFDFCYIGDFYWGRDHGDDQTRPADGELKATYGIYPGGGTFDADQGIPANETTDNLDGAGIFPILLASYVDFLKAEAVLSLETNGDSAAFLESGIRKSMDKVLNFGSVNSSFAATQDDVNAYVENVMAEYTLASNNEKLDIVMREYYLAAYGNSIEAYNGYRRTGLPSNIQIPIKEKNVPFPRTFSLPGDEVSRNSSINQRPITNQVFWDTNPAGFIN